MCLDLCIADPSRTSRIAGSAGFGASRQVLEYFLAPSSSVRGGGNIIDLLEDFGAATAPQISRLKDLLGVMINTSKRECLTRH